MAHQNNIADLKARIAYLEENRRYIQNALEMVLSLEDFYTEIGGGNYSLRTLLPEAKRRIDAIIPFEVLAFYMVDEADFSFQPTYRHPDHLAADIQEEVDYMIDEGYFAWAIRERRGVVISSRDHSRQYLLHVIANHNQVKGMFGGLLPSGQTKLPDTAMTLLSIILLHVANASESMAYTDLLKNQSRILEAQVAERTRELTQSQKELQAAMDQTRAMAEAARAASRAKGDFLANMSHELRTPLNGIIGMTEVALSTELDSNQRRIVEIISRESFSLLRQINDVLDFSKIESGKLELEQVEFDLNVLMEEIGENFALQTSEKRVELNVFIAPDTPTLLEGDPHRLRQILFNLTGNAVKFTHEGEILIEASPEETRGERTRIRFSIKDTGIGIPKEKIAQVFSSFTQADNSTTRQYGGTGLGTTISKQLVELMGGEIGAESQPERGSTFWFTAEFLQSSAHSSVAAKEAEWDVETTVLVVDSNATTRRVLAGHLDRLGIRGLTSTSGEAALALLVDRDPVKEPLHAIVTADHVSDMTAVDLKERLQEQTAAFAATPVILATSLKKMVASDNGPAHDFQAVVTKPVKIADLNAALDQVIHGICAEPLKSCPSERFSLSSGGEPAAAPRSGRILVADDYPTNQQVALMHLTAAGFDVDLADNGQQAVAAVAEQSYDLILMDIQMPVLNGLDATGKIREIESASGCNCRTPIIALTASALKGDEEKCFAAGMDGYLAKPIRRRQLIQAVDHWIGLQNRPEAPSTQQAPEEIAEAPTDGDGTIMDIATALEEFGDAETVKTIARQLIENAGGQLKRIQAFLEKEDREAIRKEAHAIKGGAATMEAPALSEAAFALETLSTAGPMDELEIGFEKLKSQFYRFRDFVSQWKGT